MVAAFEAAWGDLRAVGHVAAAPFYAAETRARLAKHIIQLAQSGVHDETELVSEALAAILREDGTRNQPAGRMDMSKVEREHRAIRGNRPWDHGQTVD